MKKQTVVVLDFGGQYNQLIARRVREHNVYCEVKSYKTPIDEIRAMAPQGIIFTGGPKSVYLEDSPRMDGEIFTLGVPILGICYGAQFLVYGLGGEIGAANADSAAEFGRTDCNMDTSSPLLKGLRKKQRLYQKTARRVPFDRAQRQVPVRRHRKRAEKVLRHAVPPRSQPHRARVRHAGQFPFQRM